MAKTRANLETNVRYKLDTAATGGTWADAQLDAYIYQSMNTAWPLFPDSVFNANATKATTHSTDAAALPAGKINSFTRESDDMRVLSLYHSVYSTTTYTGVVILPSVGELWRQQGLSNNWTSGTSTTYAAVEGCYIWVGPVGLSDSFVETYLKWPTEMSADTSLLSDAGLGDNYASAIEDYAVYLALRQTGSPKAEIVLRDWKANMATIWQTFSHAPLPAFLDMPKKK